MTRRRVTSWRCVRFCFSDCRECVQTSELNPICHLLVLLGDLTFMSTCIVSIFQNIYPTRCNVTQFIYIRKLLYMFRVVLPPIIRSAYNCIYSIWYLSHRGVRHPQHSNRFQLFQLIAADSNNGVTNTRCCSYSCLCSWWWMEVQPETCRAVSRYK
jgi:hypothetical protein